MTLLVGSVVFSRLSEAALFLGSTKVLIAGARVVLVCLLGVGLARWGVEVKNRPFKIFRVVPRSKNKRRMYVLIHYFLFFFPLLFLSPACVDRKKFALLLLVVGQLRQLHQGKAQRGAV